MSRPVARTLIVVFVAAAALSGACSSGDGESSTTVGPTDPGAEIYNVRCATCHGLSGQGGIGADLRDVEDRLTVEEHVAVVVDGQNNMPAFSGSLTAEEIDMVVAYEREAFSSSE